MPRSLDDWHDPANAGDYFANVTPTAVGYLVWSRFPVRVYLAPPAPGSSGEGASPSEGWRQAVVQAVAEWSQYLPLELTADSEGADITVYLSAPPLRLAPDPPSDESTPAARPGQLPLARVRSAETRYELYVDTATPDRPILSHRCSIWLSPRQTVDYIQAAARHELGHALGIWGHSPVETDALYAAQVRAPGPISARDISTLKRIYGQPTQLGWPLQSSTRS